MAINKKQEEKFNYNNAQKMKKNFMYKDLRRANCYNCDFSESNFNYASFRGAHFKSCNFYGVTFKSAEFTGTNFKKSKFKKSKFEDAVFEGANLEGVDFKGSQFKNTIFIGTDISKAFNLDIKEGEIRIFDEMPELEISEKLENAIKTAMTNDYVKKSRVLDTKDGSINPISIIILLENFKERALIDGLILISEKLDKDFCTLSYIIKALQGYQNQGLM
ncbi:MAG: pentapeptide repeat-containing protein [Romboutsia sp.]|uniref:pentapeptide repeat-containing protein n=1 Tax=Romboutsia sp. TaxID=1965302 RepID=UPI003F366DBC